MAFARSEETTASVSDYYTTTLSTYEPYIGHQEAKLLAEKIDSDMKQFHAIKDEDGSLIIYKMLITLDYVNKKIIFEEIIKKLNAIRFSIIESLISHLSSEKALSIAQECITKIVTQSKFKLVFTQQFYSNLDDGLIDLIDNEGEIISIKSDRLEALEMELSELIEQKIKSNKSTMVNYNLQTQHIHFDKAREQGWSIPGCLNEVREHGIMQPIDEAYAELMDRVYVQWKQTKSEEELSSMDYPLFKARMMLDVGLEEYLSYLPTLSLTPTTPENDNHPEMLVIAYPSHKSDNQPEADNPTEAPKKMFVFEATDFLKTLVSRSLFGDRSATNLPKESKTEESKKSFTML